MSSETRINIFLAAFKDDELVKPFLNIPKVAEVLAKHGKTLEEAIELASDEERQFTQDEIALLKDMDAAPDNTDRRFSIGYRYAKCNECGKYYRKRSVTWTDEKGELQDRPLRCPTCHPEDGVAELDDISKALKEEIVVSMPDLLKARGVRAKNRNNTFENFRVKNDNETALETAKAFATNGDTTLLFIGPTGVGKTHLAVSVMVEYLKTGKECWFVKEAGMGRDISDSRCFNTKETINAMHKRYCSYPLLVIDELGKGTWTNGEATEILDIIDDRIEEEDRKTILISNLSWNDFSKRFGDRITSRLDGYGKLVQILDDDNRRGMKKENGNGTAELNMPSDAKFDTANALKKKSGEITQLAKINASTANLEGGHENE